MAFSPAGRQASAGQRSRHWRPLERFCVSIGSIVAARAVGQVAREHRGRDDLAEPARRDTRCRRARNLVRREAETGDLVPISLAVLFETEWVLRSRYGLDKNEIFTAFSDLLAGADLSFEVESSIEEALSLWRDSSTRFADRLIEARHRALGRATASFDTNALKLPIFMSV